MLISGFNVWASAAKEIRAVTSSTYALACKGEIIQNAGIKSVLIYTTIEVSGLEQVGQILSTRSIVAGVCNRGRGLCYWGPGISEVRNASL